MSMDPFENKAYYKPTPLDALKVYWSFIWRNVAITLLIMLPLSIILIYTNILSFNEMGQPTLTTSVSPSGTFFVSLTSMILNIGIGFYAFRDLFKAKYSTFIFDQQQISSRHLLIFLSILNGAALLFNSIAQSQLDPSKLSGSSFLFILIQLCISYSLIYHAISAGFFKGSWRIYFPLLPREKEST